MYLALGYIPLMNYEFLLSVIIKSLQIHKEFQIK